ncbi:MAG: phospho-sugar mutase [Bacillota bacterium]|nr:phospho-sugar mutase [Bacillota bacterium]
MDNLTKYRMWLEYPSLDTELLEELQQIAGRDEEISSRFSRELLFGTGGIRGKMGAGTARMNIYMVRRATEGMSRYLQSLPQEGPRSVVIAYDTRHNSLNFARETASVLTRHGIKAYLFQKPEPTPLLSFAVRELQASAGVVVTASHNPPADNGYKVYGPDGGQITDTLAQAITREIEQVGNSLAVEGSDLETAAREGLLQEVPEAVTHRYLELLSSLILSSDWRPKGPLPVRVVYTPLHGTGSEIMPRVLQAAGVEDLFLVPEQTSQDPCCSTVRSPNPEDWDVFQMAIRLGQEKQADLLLATDLDGDRLGAAVRDAKGNFTPLTGNQMGCLMLDYILSRRKAQSRLPSRGMIVKTVVTSEMGRAIADSYGVETIETLTGFKYIGEKIMELSDTGQKVFLFGYEESYGFLMGDFVRDKDGLQAAQLLSEMTAFYKEQCMTLLDALEQLYRKHGYYLEELINLELKEGQLDQVGKTMENLRSLTLQEIGGTPLTRVDDYLHQKSRDMAAGWQPTGLPSSNSLKFYLAEKAWFCVRPSGTEPKIKIYLGAKGKSRPQAEKVLSSLKDAVLSLVKWE